MYRTLLKHTSTYSLAVVIERAGSFLMLPIYTRFLTPADYGVLELLNLTMSLLAMLMSARVGETLFYFYFQDKSESNKSRCVSTAFIAAVLLGAAAILLAVFFASALSSAVFGTPKYAPYFRLLAYGFGCSLPAEVGFCCTRAFGDSAVYLRGTIFRVVAAIGLNLLLLIPYHMGVRGILTSAFLSFLGVTVYMSRYMLKPIRFTFDGPLLVKFLKYSLPLGVSSLAVFLIHYGDRVFLRKAISLDALGVYSLAYTFGMLIAYMHSPFFTHWKAQVCAIVPGVNGSEIYVRTTTYLIVALTLAFVGLSLFISPVLHVMVGAAFSTAGMYVPWIAGAYLVRAIGAHFQCVFVLEGRPGLEARVNVVGAVVCMVSYAILIPRFKAWGAIAATLLGFVVILGYGFWIAQRLHPFRFEYGRWLRTGLAAALVVGGFYTLNPQGLWLQIAAAVLGVAAYTMGVVAGVLTREERQNVVETVKNVWQDRVMRAAASRNEAVPVSSHER